MLGTVISADMDLIGQLQPHQPRASSRSIWRRRSEARAERKAHGCSGERESFVKAGGAKSDKSGIKTGRATIEKGGDDMKA